MKSGKARSVLLLLLSIWFLLSACTAPAKSADTQQNVPTVPDTQQSEVISSGSPRIELVSFAYYDENESYVINAPVYKPWQEQYGASHKNPQAPESITLQIGDTQHKGQYIDWSTTNFPHTQITDYYCGKPADSTNEYFRINSQTGELLFYTKDKEPETEENIGENAIREIADRYAAQFLQPDQYEVQLYYNSVFNVYTVDYKRPQLGEYELPDSLRLRLEGDGEIRYVENRILKPIQKWFEETTQEEKEAFLKTCDLLNCTEKIKQAARERIAPLVHKPYKPSNVDIWDTVITATGDGKPALYVTLHAYAMFDSVAAQDIPKNEQKSCTDFTICFLISED